MPTKPAIRTPQPDSSAEPLWAISKGGQSVWAELREDSRGCEVRLFSEGRRFATHSFGSHKLAVVYASVIQRDLITDGWVKTGEVA